MTHGSRRVASTSPQQPRGDGTTWARGVAAALAASFVAAGIIIFLQAKESEYRRREVPLTVLESRTADANSSAWEAVVTGFEAQSGADAHAESAAVAKLRDAIASLQASVPNFSPPPDLALIETLYAADLNNVATLVESHQISAASAAVIQSASVYEALRARLSDEQEVAVHNAAHFQRLSSLGTVAAIMLATGFVGLLSWRTERTRRRAWDTASSQLHDLAYVDSLTNLPNRRHFMERLGAALERARDGEHSLAVLFLDLDDFKTVNDTMGHAAGDELIAFVAGRVRSAIRPSDLAARLGGDEFAIILDGIGDLEHSALVTERIMLSMERPFEVQSKMLSVHCSIGITVSEHGQEPAEELMRNADVAMYVAKSRGKNRFEFYDPTMHPELVEARDLLDDLEHALERDELVNYYQPLVELSTGRIVGAEALVRWNHPSRMLVPPLKFIPLAEQSGLIVPIGRWVLTEACRHAAMWRMRFPDRERFVMHVNVSVRQLVMDDFIDHLSAALRDFNMAPANLTLELTESMMLGDHDESARRIQEIRDLGVKIAIDDFGTGYSSLGYLRQFPVDAIKIDKSYTEQLSREGRNFEVTRSIIDLGRSLHLEIVAEGIEYEQQVAAFRALGCTLGQGYYYARPMPAEQFVRMLAMERRQPLARAA